MFNLYQLVSGAGNGQGLDALAQRFGLTREEADRAVQSLLPALSTAFMAKAAQPGGLMGLAGAMNEHRTAYAAPAGDPAAQGGGAATTGSLFGNEAILGHVVRTASQFTGVPEATLRQMLPAVVAMALGGAAEAMHAQGMGGLLGELAQGGLPGMLGHVGGENSFGGGMMGGSQAGFGGMLGHIVSSFFGGPAQPTPSAGARPDDPASALPPMMQAGMDQLFRMFQPGTAGPAGMAGPAGAPGANPFGNLSEMLGGAFGRR